MPSPTPDPPARRSRIIGYHAPQTDTSTLFALSGMEMMRAVAAGQVPPPAMSSHIGLETVSIAEGDMVMTAQPHESHYNPLGSVHGGFVATVLDSVCGCAVHTTLPAGVGYTSLEIKVSFLRPITADTGTVTAHGWVTRRGRSAAFAEADLRDSDGRVLATASSTCLIIHPDPTP